MKFSKSYRNSRIYAGRVEVLCAILSPETEYTDKVKEVKRLAWCKGNQCVVRGETNPSNNNTNQSVTGCTSFIKLLLQTSVVATRSWQSNIIL